MGGVAVGRCGSLTLTFVSFTCLGSLLVGNSIGLEIVGVLALEPETAGAAAKETGKWAESSDENVATAGGAELAGCE